METKKTERIPKVATIPNSMRMVLSVKMKVPNPNDVVVLVKNMAFPIL